MTSPASSCVFFIFVMLCSNLVVSQDCNCYCTTFDSNDLTVLLRVKGAITSDPEMLLFTWDSLLDPCSGWIGVSCDYSGRVTCIQRYSGSMTGIIHSDIGYLTNLMLLDLSSNQLSGAIPSSMENLQVLTKLSLSSNLISGTIPSSMGNLQSLTVLDLSSNQISGTIPSSIGSLTWLKYLSLSSNQLSGTIPSSMGSLTSLTHLSLSFNHLSGSIPSSIGSLTSLIELYMENNYLLGDPTSLNYVCSIVSMLYLHYNCLQPFRTTCNIHSQRSTSECTEFYRSSPPPMMSPPPVARFPPPLRKSPPPLQCVCPPSPSLMQCPPSSPSPRPPLPSVPPLPLPPLSPPVLVSPSPYCSAPPTCSCSCSCPSPPPYPPPSPPPSPPLSPPLKSPPKFPPPSPPFIQEKTGLDLLAVVRNTTRQGSFFRYASTGYIGSNTPSWSIQTSWNWDEELLGWPVRDQKNCASCWVMASISAIESAEAIVFGTREVNLLSVQQVIDCEGNGNCSGGWPINTLEYAAYTSLLDEFDYPQGNMKGECKASKPSGFPIISHYEEVAFRGILGLILAVMQQPVIVNIEARGWEFQSYTGGIFNSTSCYNEGVDHTVLIVGYTLLIDEPFWIIRNSWGPNWGENGHMKLAMKSGHGICGINTTPGYIPIIQERDNRGRIIDLCNAQSFAKVVLDQPNGLPGSSNPCGGYPCETSASSYVCRCKSAFVAVSDSSRGQTCVPTYPCSFFTKNPCGVGNCIDTSNGNFTCICPLGYSLGKSFNGKETCIPAPLVRGVQYYTIPKSSNISCALIQSTYGIPTSNFLNQNKGLSCSNTFLAANTKVNVTTKFPPCRLIYAMNQNDTCTSVKSLFKRSSLPSSVNCTHLVKRQQICVIEAPQTFNTVNEFPLCTSFYFPSSKDTCKSIINSKFKGNATAFFLLNPGLYCDSLIATYAKDIAIESVCLTATTVGSRSKACGSKKFQRVKPGESCQTIFARYFHGKRSLFRQHNANQDCTEMNVGDSFCLPPN